MWKDEPDVEEEEQPDSGRGKSITPEPELNFADQESIRKVRLRHEQDMGTTEDENNPSKERTRRSRRRRTTHQREPVLKTEPVWQTDNEQKSTGQTPDRGQIGR